MTNEDEWYNTERDLNFYEGIFNRFIEKPIEGTRLLDLGCGRGEILFLAKRKGLDVEGIEVSDYFIQYAKTKYGITLRKDLDEVSGKFDIISCISSLQYVKNPRKILSMLFSLLKENGKIYIEIPDDDSFLKKVIRMFKAPDPYQRCFMSKRILIDMLEELGFKITKIQRKRSGTSKSQTFLYKCLIHIGNLIDGGHELRFYGYKPEEG